MSAMGKCSLLLSVSLKAYEVVSCAEMYAVCGCECYMNEQLKVVVFEPQWKKSTERAERLLIPPVYSLRGIRVYDELQIAVTEVGQVKQTVALVMAGDGQNTIR